MISPQGDIVGRYDKVHLVPFGEYVPLKKILFFIRKLVDGAGDFTPGDDVVPLVMDGAKIGGLICYEGIFPDISARHGEKGSALLVNITNDAWYGRTSAPYQHMTMAAFRAIENRVYLVRAANTGISAIVDPLGSIRSRTGLFERAVLNGSVRFVPHRTVYRLYGDMFVYICIALVAGIYILSLRRRPEHDRKRV
jgi:apolipoprotein N-acyltransferase